MGLNPDPQKTNSLRGMPRSFSCPWQILFMVDALIVDEIITHQGGLSASCGPIVFEIQSSLRDGEALEAMTSPTVIYCRLELSDDQVSLVGFAGRDRRQLYLTLRTVSGIGRRSALMILDCGSVRDTLRAVAGKDRDYFSGVPGLGAKRVESVLSTLGKKYQPLPRPLPVPVRVWIEARDSLLSLGVDNPDEELFRATADLDVQPKTAEELLALAQR